MSKWQKKLIAKQKKYKQKNNNSPSSLCEVKWCKYFVVIEMVPLKKSPQTTQLPPAPNVSQLLTIRYMLVVDL